MQDRQIFFDLVKDRRTLAANEGASAPSIDRCVSRCGAPASPVLRCFTCIMLRAIRFVFCSPRNRYVEELLKASRPKDHVKLLRQHLSERQLTMALHGKSSNVSVLGTAASKSAGAPSSPPGAHEMSSFHSRQIPVAPLPILADSLHSQHRVIKLNEYRLGEKVGVAFGEGLSRLHDQLPLEELLLTKCANRLEISRS